MDSEIIRTDIISWAISAGSLHWIWKAYKNRYEMLYLSTVTYYPDKAWTEFSYMTLFWNIYVCFPIMVNKTIHLKLALTSIQKYELSIQIGFRSVFAKDRVSYFCHYSFVYSRNV